MSEIENFITISKYQIAACLPIVLWREEAESLIDEIETLIERIAELEELDKNLCETIEQMRYTIVSLSAGESVKFDLHCSKCGKETKILHPVAIEGEYEFELKQRIAELEEQIKELYADNEALKEHYPHFLSEQRWIPVSERLPEVGKYVFLFMVSKTYGVGIGTGYVPKDKKYQWVVTQMPIPYDEITHWMPLPELPEANL